MAKEEFSYVIICEGENEIDMIFPHTTDKKINKILKDYIIVATWNGMDNTDSSIRVLRVRRKNNSE